MSWQDGLNEEKWVSAFCPLHFHTQLIKQKTEMASHGRMPESQENACWQSTEASRSSILGLLFGVFL